jgi:hypothetical protein
VTRTVDVAEFDPPGPVTVSRTETTCVENAGMKFVGYVWVTIGPDPLVPSPKSQSHEVICPCDDDPLKAHEVFTAQVLGFRMTAIGGGIGTPD